MITLPEFIRDKQFRELSPKEGNNKYRFVTLRPIIVKWSGYCSPNSKISFRGKNDREWLFMDSEHFIIMKDYAWDGCTPKKHLPLVGWIGTPDFEETILASLIHDAFCQFMGTPHFPFGSYTNNKIFQEILKKNHFKFADLYYFGVESWSNIGNGKIYPDVSSIIIDK